MAKSTLYVDDFRNSSNPWSVVGVTPYLDDDDYPSNYIKNAASTSALCYAYFQILEYDPQYEDDIVITQAKLFVKLYVATGYDSEWFLYLNNELVSLTYDNDEWYLCEEDVSDILTTIDDVNSAYLRLVHTLNIPSNQVLIDYAYLEITYTGIPESEGGTPTGDEGEEYTEYTGGPYITVESTGSNGEIFLSHILSTNAIGPVNIPYSRVSTAIGEIMNLLYTNYVPWEYWIDYDGRFHMGIERGEDKSDTISFSSGDRFNKMDAERSVKQSAQRVKVTGQGEGKTQDDVTSSWKINSAAMDAVGTFYEKIESDKVATTKELADAIANIILTASAPIAEEISLKDVVFDDFTADDVDIGDYITTQETTLAMDAVYRVKTIRKRVNDEGGEIVDLTVSKVLTNIADKLASLQRKLDELLHSSTYMDKYTDTGGRTGNIDPDAIEDVWGITGSNKVTFSPPEKSSDADPDDILNHVGGGSYECVSNTRFYIMTNTAGADEFILETKVTGYPAHTLDFDDDPRFTCEIEFDSDGGGDEWTTDDTFRIGIYNRNEGSGAITQGFGFVFVAYSDNLIIRVNLLDGVAAEQTITITGTTGWLDYDEVYKLEARLDYREKIVRYYFGSDTLDFQLVAVLPLSQTTEASGQSLRAMFLKLNEASGLNLDDNRVVVVYNWKSQAKALYMT